MRKVQIYSRERRVLAEVWRDREGAVRHEVYDASLTGPLDTFVQAAVTSGVRYRTGHSTERNGEMILVEEVIVVAADDERFLAALADAVRRHSFSGRRLFAQLAPANREAANGEVADVA